MNQIPTQTDHRAKQFFLAITCWPKAIIALSLLLIVATALFIPSLQKNTRSDAFMPPDHPALIYRNKVKEIFGLNDPMVIAIVNESEQGIFNPQSLALVAWLTEELESIEPIDPSRINSLTTSNDIIGTEEGLQVESFFEFPPTTQVEAEQIRSAITNFPLYVGNLVARDGSTTLIVAELEDQSQAQAVYEILLALVKKAPKGEYDTLHVAGEGAISGYMGAYIDADAMRLNPIAALIITLVIFIAFRTLRGTVLPNLVVLGTVATALGTMAAVGVPFFIITNAMPVVLVGIAVADSIHILSQYYEEMAQAPDKSSRQLAVSAMSKMWRPITITTFTTIAGFLGLSLASVMPPMTFFGLFAMLGVAMAWLYSMTVVPAFLTLLKPKQSKAFIGNNQGDLFGNLMSCMGSVMQQDEATPERILQDSDWGMRLSTFWNGWDISLNYLYHYHDMPVLYRKISTTTNGGLMTITPTYERSHFIGGGFSTAQGDFTLRGELGHSTDRYLSTNDITDSDGVIHTNELSYLFGLDWFGISDTLISGQLSQSRLGDHKTGIVRDQVETTITFLIRRDFYNETLRAELLVLHSPDPEDGLARPKLIYQFSDEISLSLGADIFYGDNGGLFGQFDQRDRLMTTIEITI
ncbi:MAG: MMPL family transporter [Candidatus Thiodiazotropha sp. (ex Dulcina madagascariensis)]|nr:MMPL family transporter [Candidatus Thiodiazotropha sp. (ex Dulcina madagascariensis)]